MEAQLADLLTSDYSVSRPIQAARQQAELIALSAFRKFMFSSELVRTGARFALASALADYARLMSCGAVA